MCKLRKLYTRVRGHGERYECSQHSVLLTHTEQFPQIEFAC